MGAGDYPCPAPAQAVSKAWAAGPHGERRGEILLEMRAFETKLVLSMVPFQT